MNFNKILLFSIAVIQMGCAHVDEEYLPIAHLIVGEASYELDAGTSCWDNFCDDVFGHFTNKTPIEISEGTFIRIHLKSSSAFKEGFVDLLETKYFSPTKLSVEDPEEEKYIEKYRVWEVSAEYYESIESIEAKNRILLSGVEKIIGPVKSGEYILSIGSWWERGDVFHSAYIRVSP